MPNAYVSKLASDLNVAVSTVESKWNQAKEIIADQYPNKSQDDDSFWALVTSLTKKLLGVHESFAGRTEHKMAKSLITGNDFTALLESEMTKLDKTVKGTRVLKEDVVDFSMDPNFAGAGDYVVDSDSDSIVSGPYDPESDDANSACYDYQLQCGVIGSGYVVTLDDNGSQINESVKRDGRMVLESLGQVVDFSNDPGFSGAGLYRVDPQTNKIIDGPFDDINDVDGNTQMPFYTAYIEDNALLQPINPHTGGSLRVSESKKSKGRKLMEYAGAPVDTATTLFGGAGYYLVDPSDGSILDGPFATFIDAQHANTDVRPGFDGWPIVYLNADGSIDDGLSESEKAKALNEEAMFGQTFNKADAVSAFQDAVDDGEGFDVGDGTDTPNTVGDELGAAMVLRYIGDADGDVAVYQTSDDDRYIAVGYTDDDDLTAADITDYLS